MSDPSAAAGPGAAGPGDAAGPGAAAPGEGAAGPVVAVTPPPDDDEVAAIVAAVRLALQRPEARRVEPVRSGWRFAGRWWR